MKAPIDTTKVWSICWNDQTS